MDGQDRLTARGNDRYLKRKQRFAIANNRDRPMPPQRGVDVPDEEVREARR
jgi:hypothetical protein